MSQNARRDASKLRARYAKCFNVPDHLVKTREYSDDTVVYAVDESGAQRKDLPEWSLGYSA